MAGPEYIRQYCFLFSFLVLLVVGNLIVNFNLIDLTYLCFMIVMGLRYIKIKYTT